MLSQKYRTMHHLGLTDFRLLSLSLHCSCHRTAAPSLLSLCFWANLKPRGQRPLSFQSVWSQCQPQCQAPSICMPHTLLSPPPTHRSTIRRMSLSFIHQAIYTPDPFIQPIRAGWALWRRSNVFRLEMPPAARPLIQHQLQHSCRNMQLSFNLKFMIQI